MAVTSTIAFDVAIFMLTVGRSWYMLRVSHTQSLSPLYTILLRDGMQSVLFLSSLTEFYQEACILCMCLAWLADTQRLNVEYTKSVSAMVAANLVPFVLFWASPIY